MMPTPEEYKEAADAAEDTAEKLMERGEQLLSLGRRLMNMATELNAVGEAGVTAAAPESEEQRSVGKQGVVTIGIATEAAKRLGTFSRAELGEALGLNGGATSKWLTILSNNKPWPIIRRVQRGQYKYLGPEGKPKDPTEAPEHASEVERSAGVGAQREATGEVVAFTGKVKGTSHKPGLDKKLSKTRRIRRQTGQIIGGRG